MERLKKRSEIDKKYKWVLEDIYPSLDKWEKDFKFVEENIPIFSSSSGKLQKDPSLLLSILKDYTRLMETMEKVFVYAHLLKDQDNSDQDSQVIMGRARTLLVEADSACSFLVPDILNIDAGKLKEIIKDDKLSDYRHYLDDAVRRREHVLTSDNEKILALTGEMAVSSQLIFSMIDNADIKFPLITGEDGKKVELTKGRYQKFMESRKRKVRKDAFNALYDTYEKQKNTMASVLGSSVKKDIFYSRVRNYGSSLKASLFDDNVPVSVYDGLIDSVSKNLDAMHKYMDLRKKALKLDKLHMYDIYVPIVEDVDFDIPYKEAVGMVTDSLSPLKKTYTDALKQGLKGGWVDVFENRGKTGGAFSFGCYGSHPYILLNYSNIMDDVFTLAHEAGHAMHSYFSNKTQPYIKAGYRIFVAEVASILNEILLTEFLLKNLEDSEEKQYILNHYLEQFRGTVYRQTMFAEFEKIIHQNSEKQKPLTMDSLSDIYHDLNVKYYGKNIVIDSRIDLEWARIPHFYSAFYVYKYALGFSAAAALSEKILAGDNDAVKRYMEFLSGGGSDYPLELLKKTGVDMTSPEPVDRALSIFGGLVDKMAGYLNIDLDN